MTIYERIKYLREQKGWSQQELAEKVGFKTASAVNKIELGARNLNQTKIKAFADALGTTPSFLIGDDNTKDIDLEYIKFLYWKVDSRLKLTPREQETLNSFIKDNGTYPDECMLEHRPHSHCVPRLGAISCGIPLASEENYEGLDSVPDNISCDFSLICEGFSMINARINDGDIVYIKQQPVVENGEIAAVLVDGTEKLLKRVYINENSITLQAENPEFPPRIYIGEDMNRIQIIGKAVGFTSVIH